MCARCKSREDICQVYRGGRGEGRKGDLSALFVCLLQRSLQLVGEAHLGESQPSVELVVHTMRTLSKVLRIHANQCLAQTHEVTMRLHQMVACWFRQMTNDVVLLEEIEK